MTKKTAVVDQKYVTQEFLGKELLTFKNEILEEMRAMHNELVAVINDNFGVFRDEIHELKVVHANHESRIRHLENNPRKFCLIKQL